MYATTYLNSPEAVRERMNEYLRKAEKQRLVREAGRNATRMSLRSTVATVARAVARLLGNARTESVPVKPEFA